MQCSHINRVSWRNFVSSSRGKRRQEKTEREVEPRLSSRRSSAFCVRGGRVKASSVREDEGQGEANGPRIRGSRGARVAARRYVAMLVREGRGRIRHWNDAVFAVRPFLLGLRNFLGTQHGPPPPRRPPLPPPAPCSHAHSINMSTASYCLREHGSIAATSRMSFVKEGMRFTDRLRPRCPVPSIFMLPPAFMRAPGNNSLPHPMPIPRLIGVRSVVCPKRSEATGGRARRRSGISCSPC